MKNPLTWLVMAASAWVLVLGVNEAWVSAGVIAVSQLAALARLRNVSVAAATTVSAIPVGLSMLLIHAPHGDQPGFLFLTRDGSTTAGVLTLRYAALVSALLVAASAMTVADLAKALQGNRLLGSQLAYIVGSAIQLLPQGSAELASVRDATALRGRRVRGPGRALKFLGIPLITRLLTAGADRTIPLEVAGMDVRGPRTVLRPVPDPVGERVLRCVLPVVALGAVGVALWG